MNAPLAAQLPSFFTLLGPVLQGAGIGSLLAAAVLLRAFRRRLQVTPWAVTAAWSLVGAAIALVVTVVLCLSGGRAQRSMSSARVDRTRSWSRPTAICERSRSTSRRMAGSRISSGSARR